MQFNITFKTIFEYILKKLVLCIQIRFVSTEKTTRITSRASCLVVFFVTEKNYLNYVVTRDVCPSVRHSSVRPSILCRNNFGTRF